MSDFDAIDAQIDRVLRHDTSLRPSNSNESLFLNSVKNNLRNVFKYRNSELRRTVVNVVPVDKINDEVKRKRSALKSKCEGEAYDVSQRDLFVFELLAWFKHSFFSWFDKPRCDRCSNLEMRFDSYQKPTAEEISGAASKVECYKCSSCLQHYRFPRYNDPLKLLHTRQGRCGEWANCFSAILYALDFDARFILEFGDHVWVEVYSDSQKRWIHCDPCENAIDSPLMYEHGWNKQLTYCLAFSCNEIQDVTWRYTSKYKEVMRRRAHQCREHWVSHLMLKVSEILQAGYSQEQKQKFMERRLNELVEFIWIPNQEKVVSENELKGRQSGSLLWRIQRGEVDSNITNKEVGHVFHMTNKETKIAYNCNKDVYKFGDKTIKGWENGVFSYCNLFRKVEHDWKMCYLSRCESLTPQTGTVIWKINFADVTCWTEIDLQLKCQTYGSGVIDFLLTANPEAKQFQLKPNTVNTIKRSDVSNTCVEFVIKATLYGGDSDLESMLAVFVA
ncbi:peptide-N(4)-(N-acetyl-beta-glucosaminyl)asparagine amidase-like isoform X1 [Dinothrombium tinctorium]|uniref:Peptide-N(4)-(N-acetyl-beta-glucosaminyl)asparagine amidase n=1 Tax=Dinothrombium tinctorium TaxID=1965070 RepID=A0A3S3NNP6_9ACAR|nr:peptide-N(4)-(N-acetyl-beta-glucosaminyl)asparagine amidase-like isoform X1 [Dinothrombium tinctorium]RWS06283.1 peptide-N(4)-(N-acetyl-beta-glucosaminyl)asparagine amidase-like isoform X1 [Dinothrombium tinctorium]